MSFNRPIHWILDWDGTITKQDTLNALVNIARDSKPQANVLEAWKRVTQAYLHDYEATLKTLLPDDAYPTTIFEEMRLLKKLKEVEKRSIDRVSESGIFKGLTNRQVEDGSKEAVRSGSVQLRSGYSSFLTHVLSRTQPSQGIADSIDILSVNWSCRFIAGCLDAAGVPLKSDIPTHDDFLQEWLEPCGSVTSTDDSSSATSLLFQRIFANELQGLAKGEVSTGVLCADGGHQIISSHDKLSYLQKLRKLDPFTLKPMPIIYVGDSWTDLECLLAADLGICIRDDPMTWSQSKLADSLTRLSITCPRVGNWKSGDNWGITWARDFDEIKAWVVGADAD